MLPCSGLGDNAILAHAFGEQALTQSVVDLVRSSVGKVFTLEIDARAAKLVGQVFGVVEGGWPPHEMLGKVPHLGLELLVGLGGDVLSLKLFDCAHQRFGNKASAELAEAASFVR